MIVGTGHKRPVFLRLRSPPMGLAVAAIRVENGENERHYRFDENQNGRLYHFDIHQNERHYHVRIRRNENFYQLGVSGGCRGELPQARVDFEKHEPQKFLKKS